ncbi:MAG: gluconate 2-dehydrogenase subunit 3 family protein [Acidobacteriaceae bacterium]|nr:gluconate 2-dehydrogenase subunit 3 family protein [Acidobacteriaceae bacterium]
MIEIELGAELVLRDPETQQPLAPKQQPGYYPGYSTLGQKGYWDATTRRAVEDRVYNVPPIRFFTEDELLTITVACERILPQSDRLPARRIPIVPHIDERLYKNEIDGYRFAGMPSDRDAYRLGIRAIEDMARSIHKQPFVDLEPLKQDFILKSLHDGKPLVPHKVWEAMSVSRFWHMIVQDCVSAYYSHPWAWDEIGYGGPAYPRAYTRLENGLPEPWEVDEQRYEWAAPAESLSDTYEPGDDPGSVSGQGGTH